MAETLAQSIEARLRDLQPEQFALEDQSAAHAGHPGARSGAHFHLAMVSARFVGLSRVQRHRLVYERLAPLMQDGIHALTMQLRAPGEAH
jgi:BolA protein